MKLWQEELRHGLFPLLSVFRLQKLSKAIEEKDPMLITGITAKATYKDGKEKLSGCCLIGYCGYVESRDTVESVTDYFKEIVEECEDRHYGLSWLLKWYDYPSLYFVKDDRETSKSMMFNQLNEEIKWELERRANTN